MEKDNQPKNEEISTEELEQVNGGMTKADLIAGKFFKVDTPQSSLELDALKINTTLTQKQ